MNSSSARTAEEQRFRPSRFFIPVFCAVFAFASAPVFASKAFISKARGRVEVLRADPGVWQRIKAPHSILSGDMVRTGRRSKATIVFEDGSKVEIGAKSEMKVEPKETLSTFMRMSFGRLKAWIKRAKNRRFEIKTPKAVASVRGTEFSVVVSRFGNTTVDLYKGLLAVSDNDGNETLLQPNQRVEVDSRGLGKAGSIDESDKQKRESRRQQLKSQVALGQSREQVMAAAAEELKLAEYQEGKTLVDVSGNRVRLTQYILRPRSDQFKLVVLNDRDNRFDYFFYQGTFNTTLPTDLSVALRQLSGTPDTAPTFYLTSYATGRSNTIDTITELASGGHPVDVNNNASTSDDVSAYFDATLNQFVSLNGRPFFKTLFDNYAIAFNNKTLTSWAPKSTITPFNGTSGTGIQSMSDVDFTYIGGNAAYTIVSDFPDSTLIHQRIREAWGDGTTVEWNNYIIDNDGNVAPVSAFAGVTAGTAFQEKLLNFNYEQVITSSLFGDRKIDLVVEPKVLIQSGLIQ